MANDGVARTDGGQDPGTMATVGEVLYRVIKPLSEAVRQGPLAMVDFLYDAGIGNELQSEELTKVVDVLLEAQNGLETVESMLGDEGPAFESVEDVTDFLDAVVSVLQTVRSVNSLQFQSVSVQQVGDALVDHLVVRYLAIYHPTLHDFFVITHVITEEYGPGPEEIDFGNLADAITDPNTAARSVLKWGSVDFRDRLLLRFLGNVATEFGLTSVTTSTDIERLNDLSYEKTKPTGLDPQNRPEHLDVTLLELTAETQSNSNIYSKLGTRLHAFPYAQDQPTGLLLLAYATGSFSDTIPLGGGWTFSTAFGGNQSFGLGFRPTSSGTEAQLVSRGGLSGEYHAKAALTYDSASTGSGGDEQSPAETVLLGSPDGTRLALGRAGARAKFDYDGDSGTLTVEFPAEGALRVRPSGGFLEMVLPEEVDSEFDVTTGWSSADGLYFEGGATLEVALPLHQKLGPITLKEIYLSLGPDPESGALTAEASAAATVKLGPVSGTVDRMGIDAELSFPENRDGNLGPADLELGFKPPKGVGLSVSADPVTGSGYLFFDPENERYGGAAQLKVSDLSLTALGLITTELPDGSDDFSMQVVVAGEFQPIQLGFGFTLTGVGGILGINRKFRTKALRRVVRTGSLDSVLFPEKETVKNNPMQLISDLRSVFPPKRGSYLFGPMVQLGYGTPAVLKSSLGAVLEIPSFRVLIVGRFELVLPNHEAERPSGMPEQAPWPPIVLNLDVMGKIDIPGKSISIDASLYDSRVLMWTVEGDMALRSSWGRDPRFILSVGGFNPRYTPPKDAPGLKKLDRVKVSLDVPGGQPSVEFTGYFAVTSNTFQVGANVSAEVTVGKLRISGELGFDALFDFSPFKFIFDFIAKFMIEAPSFKAGFSLDGTIKGPTPFNINGTVNLTVGPVEVSTKIDVTIGPGGQSEKLPAAEILPELREALNHPKNWDAQLPETGESAVSLRGVAAEHGTQQAEQGKDPKAGPVLAHPLGIVTVRQSVVPLRYTIEKFGEAKPKTYDRFEIVDVSIDDDTVDRRPVDGQFAPAKYRRMSDTKKLDSADFVRETAGRAIGEGDILVGGESKSGSKNATRAQFGYEEHLYDEGEGKHGKPLVDATETEAGQKHTAHSAQSLVRERKGPSGHDRGRFSVREDDPAAEVEDDDGLFSVDDIGYLVVDAETLTPVATDVARTEGEYSSEAEFAGLFDATTSGGLSMEAARDALTEYARRTGTSEDDLRVVPEHVLEARS